jgi:hypothetical protein
MVALFGFGAPVALFAVAALALVALGVGLLRLPPRPSPAEIDRRIERSSGLRHRPIAMLEDVPETDSELSLAIWRLHRRRLEAELAAMRAGLPLDVAGQDRFALRALALLLLLTGAITAANGLWPGLIGSLRWPAWPFAGPSVAAWITPPAYTGQPPLVLTPGGRTTVLAGSRLSLVVEGARRRPAARYAGTRLALDGEARQGFRADMVLTASGRLRLGEWWHRIAAWDIRVVAPNPPELALRTLSVEDHVLLIGWRAQDRYGLSALRASLVPALAKGALPQVIELPLDSAEPRLSAGVAREDVAKSPYAGLMVEVRVTARNLAGVAAEAGPLSVLLPPPALQDKTAARLASLRQSLALAPEQRQQTGASLQKLAEAPRSPVSANADLQMAVLSRQLQRGEIGADTAQERLGLLVQQVEEGPDFEPAQALAAADQALEQALRQGLNGAPPDAATMQAMLQTMHAALARHMQAVRGAAGDTGEMISPSDLDSLAAQVARDEAAGRTVAAAAELRRFVTLLRALESAKPMTAEQMRRDAASEQAAHALSQIAQGEAALLDQTNEGGAQPSSQAALQNQLGAVRQTLSGAGLSPAGLPAAATAMQAAQTALQRRQTGAAMDAEGSAITALQKAGAALSAGLGRRFGTGPSEEEGPAGGPDEATIPGLLPANDTTAGAIEQQIIRTDGQPELPNSVHKYYYRLLNQDPR